MRGKIISKIKEKPIKYSQDRGFYFKGEFLHRYKSEALALLRERVINQGIERGFGKGEAFQEGGKILVEEYYLLIEEHNKLTDKVKKTEETKRKHYYPTQKIMALKEKMRLLTQQLEEAERESKDE